MYKTSQERASEVEALEAADRMVVTRKRLVGEMRKCLSKATKLQTHRINNFWRSNERGHYCY